MNQLDEPLAQKGMLIRKGGTQSRIATTLGRVDLSRARPSSLPDSFPDEHGSGKTDWKLRLRQLNELRALTSKVEPEHRRNLHDLLALAPISGRLVIVGAGDCRDWRVEWLVQSFQSVALVDVDRDAILRAYTGTHSEVTSAAEWYPGVDALAPPDELGESLRGSADLLISDCILSDSRRAGRPHALWKAHSEWLAKVLAPQGLALVITALAKGESFPNDSTTVLRCLGAPIRWSCLDAGERAQVEARAFVHAPQPLL